jgi:hypothetical protein
VRTIALAHGSVAPMHVCRSLLVAVRAVLLALPIGLRADAQDEEEKAETRVQMRRVWAAIMAWKKDHGEVPDHLSDLIPKYLPDTNALLAPKQRRTGAAGDNNYRDPKFRGSFCYEFSALKFAGPFHPE